MIYQLVDDPDVLNQFFRKFFEYYCLKYPIKIYIATNSYYTGNYCGLSV